MRYFGGENGTIRRWERGKRVWKLTFIDFFESGTELDPLNPLSYSIYNQSIRKEIFLLVTFYTLKIFFKYPFPIVSTLDIISDLLLYKIRILVTS